MGGGFDRRCVLFCGERQRVLDSIYEQAQDRPRSQRVDHSLVADAVVVGM